MSSTYFSNAYFSNAYFKMFLMFKGNVMTSFELAKTLTTNGLDVKMIRSDDPDCPGYKRVITTPAFNNVEGRETDRVMIPVYLTDVKLVCHIFLYIDSDMSRTTRHWIEVRQDCKTLIRAALVFWIPDNDSNHPIATCLLRIPGTWTFVDQ